MGINNAASRQYPHDAGVVFATLCSLAPQLSMTLRSAVPQTGVIELSTGVSFSTWGETVTVQVLAAGPSATFVNVSSGLKFGLVDWGKNTRNLERLFDALGAALATAPVAAAPPGAWHPDPAGRHQLRWWDGVRWTENVSDAGQPGTDPIG